MGKEQALSCPSLPQVWLRGGGQFRGEKKEGEEEGAGKRQGSSLAFGCKVEYGAELRLYTPGERKKPGWGAIYPGDWAGIWAGSMLHC